MAIGVLIHYAVRSPQHLNTTASSHLQKRILPTAAIGDSASKKTPSLTIVLCSMQGGQKVQTIKEWHQCQG